MMISSPLVKGEIVPSETHTPVAQEKGTSEQPQGLPLAWGWRVSEASRLHASGCPRTPRPGQQAQTPLLALR